MMVVEVNKEWSITETDHNRDPATSRRLLSPDQVADWLQVPAATLYVWKYKGEGPPVHRVGRHLRYRQDQVAAWIDGRRADRGDEGRSEGGP